MPDSQLFELAEARQLSQPEVLRDQVERMLNDPKITAFTEYFIGQWLSLRAIDATSPDRKLYPEYDEILRAALIKEPGLFFDEVLRSNLSLANFVASDFTFLNERLARHYRIPGVEGAEMRKVALPPESHRGGVMTMASVLKVTANGTTTSPVLRGAWVLDRILGTPPSPPPPDVGAIEPDIRGATTIREQLAKHRNVASCASCHRKIDPPGFALESFHVIGGWREHYRSTGDGSPRNINGRRVRFWPGPAVDPSDVLPDGRRFDNIDGFKRLLLADKDQLARNLTEKLLTYATGAALTIVDQSEIERIVGKIREEGYGFRSLVHGHLRSGACRNEFEFRSPGLSQLPDRRPWRGKTGLSQRDFPRSGRGRTHWRPNTIPQHCLVRRRIGRPLLDPDRSPYSRRQLPLQSIRPIVSRGQRR